MTATGETRRTFLPAAGRHWLLPAYDFLGRLLGTDAARGALLAQADIRPAMRVLDIGCGTGSLLIEITRRHPDVEAVGLDPDARALARARRKAGRSRARIRFDEGFADGLPYPGASFDLVFSTFMFHHLRPHEKEQTLREVRRVLKPRGMLHLLDFTTQHPSRHGIHGLLGRALHRRSAHPGHEEAASILALMNRTGLAGAQEAGARDTFFGRVALFQSSAPGAWERGPDRPPEMSRRNRGPLGIMGGQPARILTGRKTAMSVQLNPYLSFKDDARQAMEFYRSVFGGELTVSTFKEFHASQDPSEDHKVMHAKLEANGIVLMASDTPKRMEHQLGSGISLSLSGDDQATLTGYFNKLAAGGMIVMPLEKAVWGDTFGMCRDKFGMQWMVNITARK